jgi:hypothetical protein
MGRAEHKAKKKQNRNKEGTDNKQRPLTTKERPEKTKSVFPLCVVFICGCRASAARRALTDTSAEWFRRALGTHESRRTDSSDTRARARTARSTWFVAVGRDDAAALRVAHIGLSWLSNARISSAKDAARQNTKSASARRRAPQLDRRPCRSDDALNVAHIAPPWLSNAPICAA